MFIEITQRKLKFLINKDLIQSLFYNEEQNTTRILMSGGTTFDAEGKPEDLLEKMKNPLP